MRNPDAPSLVLPANCCTVCSVLPGSTTMILLWSTPSGVGHVETRHPLCGRCARVARFLYGLSSNSSPKSLSPSEQLQLKGFSIEDQQVSRVLEDARSSYDSMREQYQSE